MHFIPISLFRMVKGRTRCRRVNEPLDTCASPQRCLGPVLKNRLEAGTVLRFTLSTKLLPAFTKGLLLIATRTYRLHLVLTLLQSIMYIYHLRISQYCSLITPFSTRYGFIMS